MKISIFHFTIGEIVLAAITFMDFINEYMRFVAALAATVTLVFAIVKFIIDYRESKKRSKLLDLQIEDQVKRLTKL